MQCFPMFFRFGGMTLSVKIRMWKLMMKKDQNYLSQESKWILELEDTKCITY